MNGLNISIGVGMFKEIKEGVYLFTYKYGLIYKIL